MLDLFMTKVRRCSAENNNVDERQRKQNKEYWHRHLALPWSKNTPRHPQPLCREIGLSKKHWHWHLLLPFRTIHVIHSLCVVKLDYRKTLTLTPRTTMISGLSTPFKAFVSWEWTIRKTWHWHLSLPWSQDNPYYSQPLFREIGLSILCGIVVFPPCCVCGNPTALCQSWLIASRSRVLLPLWPAGEFHFQSNERDWAASVRASACMIAV